MYTIPAKPTTRKQIEALISTRAEENLYREFKDARALSAQHRKEIAKNVAAFANADGGAIYYGVTEENHVASAVSFVDGNEFTKEWLEHVITDRIRPGIAQLRIDPVRFGKKLEQTVYVVHIAASEDAPHMADNEYPLRQNFKVVAMEDYQVRAAMNRLLPTKLEASVKINGSMTVSKLYSLTVQFYVKNMGHTIEDRYKLEVSFARQLTDANANQPKLIRENPGRIEGFYQIISIPNQAPLFQGEQLFVDQLAFNIAHYNFKALLLPFKVKLYFSAGVHEQSIDLQQYCTVDNKPLRKDMLLH